MNLKSIAIGVVSALFVILIISVATLFLATEEEAGAAGAAGSAIDVKSFQAVGSDGYALFGYQGSANATLISLRDKPSKKVFIYSDPQAVGAEKMAELEAQLKTLEPYGYEVTLTESSAMGEGIYLVPTGAIPVFILAKLKNNYSSGTIIYIGEKDLVISSGIKKLDWFSELDADQKRRIVAHPGTLDDYIDSGDDYLIEEILTQNWSREANRTVGLKASGLSSLTVPMEEGRYLRLLVDGPSLKAVEDSALLSQDGMALEPQPSSIYPWQKADLEYALGKTNGTARMIIDLAGQNVLQEELARVTDENVFVKRLSFEEPGDYVIRVEDNSGRLASGILHVSDMEVSLIEQNGIAYSFRITSDGVPLDNQEIYVALAGSQDKQKFYVDDGMVYIRAKAEPGPTTFDFDMFGGTLPVTVQTRSTNVFDFYFRWGLPALLIVLVVFFGARLSRRPIYTLRFGESASTLRQEVQLSVGEVTDLIGKTREDLHLGDMPITPAEYTVSLRRHITNGADVTEGNVEGIFKRLVGKGLMANHREFYQLSGEGDVRKRALKRMIKEKLIENGVMYKEKGDLFSTKDFDIGFFGTSFKKKGIVIFDDESEIRRTLSSLSESERVELRLKQANDLLVLMPVDRLSDVL